MDFIPYKVNEYLENTFYQVPKELFTNPYYKKLNSDSILLYALLLDRLSVSRKNEWIDEDGNVFLLFARKDVEKKLKLSDKTVTKAFKLLAVDLCQVFRHIFLRIFINFSSFAWGVVINIKENL